jgi:GT2 family glycosyltransferase
MNAWLFRRSLFEAIGVFDTGYRIVADREFMIRLALAGIVFARTVTFVYRYRRRSGSFIFDKDQKFLSEFKQEHLKKMGGFLSKARLPGQARQNLTKLPHEIRS